MRSPLKLFESRNSMKQNYTNRLFQLLVVLLGTLSITSILLTGYGDTADGAMIQLLGVFSISFGILSALGENQRILTGFCILMSFLLSGAWSAQLVLSTGPFYQSSFINVLIVIGLVSTIIGVFLLLRNILSIHKQPDD